MNRHRTYRPPLPQISADPLRGNPCDSRDPRRFPRDPRRHSPPAHPILNSSFLILNWTYTFSAKERDSETGLSYFGSRYYSSDLSVWLSVDPMSDKYPSLSPYVYCADNPVRVVDPNGEDYVVVVEGNTITIKDMYFVTIDTQKGVDEAIRNFKEQAPNLSYTSQDGKTYSVKFDLSIAKVFDTPEQAKQAKEENKGCGYANYCVSGEMYRAGFSETQSLSTSFNFSTDDMWKYVGKGKVIIKTKKR